MDEGSSTPNPANPDGTDPLPSPVPGPDAGQELPEAPPPRPIPSQFAPSATLFWTIVLLGFTGVALYGISANREYLISQPERYLQRVVGRDLDAAESIADLPPWQRLVNSLDSSDESDTLKEAVETCERFKKFGTVTDHATVSRTLAILLAESKRLPEAETEVKLLDQADSDPTFVAAFRAAYLGSTERVPLAKEAHALREVKPPWARDKMAGRLAANRGDRPAATQSQAQILQRGREVHARVTMLSLTNLFLILTGLVILAAWFGRGRPGPNWASGLTVSRWTVADGYGTIVRGAVAAMGLAGAILMIAEFLPALNGFTTLLSALPLLWFAHRYLLLLHGVSFSSCFGLAVARKDWWKVVGFSLVILSLMNLGEVAIGALSNQEPVPGESIPEELLFDPWPQVMLSAIDAIVWAPLVEEVVFRGLVYSTLRRRFPVVVAAPIGSAIFAIVHGYSLQGFLIIFWSGLLWSLAYEKSRSLWPGILCHALSNTLAVGSPILIFRL